MIFEKKNFEFFFGNFFFLKKFNIEEQTGTFKME